VLFQADHRDRLRNQFGVSASSWPRLDDHDRLEAQALLHHAVRRLEILLGTPDDLGSSGRRGGCLSHRRADLASSVD
jgi:hypothetical protein